MTQERVGQRHVNINDQELQVAVQVPRINVAMVRLAGSTWSLQITISDTVLHNGVTHEVPTAILSVPWPLAKALFQMMGMAIEQYEMAEGPIALPRLHQAAMAAFADQVARKQAAAQAGNGAGQGPEGA